ncbi:TPA: hypothetical protein IXR70_001147 [Enterococcus faecium]|uniref:hypothetical protein n=1 Tax=Enterococcus faecium TaxID=1352 RepID=UPI001F2097C9|nr:hypothetical protein [Enterococcus faecium]MCF8623279.1 hypothetical protein [Enterococcus faecium]HAQ4446006.1 hypothetical protein [Enterococcus faecium]HAQ4457142.1 hypothetical protein [Enterococcus faecium]
MISVKGLGDEIFEAMMSKAQQDIKEKIISAAAQGQTSCTVRSRGTTPSFLLALEDEGILNIKRRDNSVRLFWQF